MIRPYLRDMINVHKAPMKLKFNLPDKVIDYETITMQINFTSSKDF